MLQPKKYVKFLGLFWTGKTCLQMNIWYWKEFVTMKSSIYQTVFLYHERVKSNKINDTFNGDY